MDFDVSQVMGWIDNPMSRFLSRKAVGLTELSSLAPALMAAASSTDADILLYKAWKDVLGSYPNYPAQTIGDCTSFGHGHGYDLSECVQIALTGADNKAAFAETCTEAIYGAAREKADMLHSWSDGCTGAASVQALLEVGVVSRAVTGPYDGHRAKSWGSSGIPADIREEAAAHKLGSSAIIETLAELDAALAAGSPVSICSNVGFQGHGGFHRDANGICYAGGSWPHCMMIAGKISSDGQSTYVICQSWGNQMPDGPQPFDLPPFAFRALASDVQRILNAGDSHALNKAAVFAPLSLPSHWTNRGMM
ncbi:MAG: hypothetical protein KGL39_45135 [Patescibacteria group bacterium]|nr:hypothetical protein [Patescibacteria group bacterium]